MLFSALIFAIFVFFIFLYLYSSERKVNKDTIQSCLWGVGGQGGTDDKAKKIVKTLYKGGIIDF